MASPPILEFDTLLAPIPGAEPAGQPLQFDVRKKLDDLRKEIDPNQFAPDDPRRPEQPQVADWAGIEQLGKDTLAQSSKDLMLATRLTEALVKQYGFRGLRDGLRLMRRMTDECWDRIHPGLQDDDIEARAGAFIWLDDDVRGARFPYTVRSIALTKTKDDQKYSWQHWKDSQDPKSKGTVTGQVFDQAVSGTLREHCQAVVEDIAECIVELKKLQDALGARMGEASAPGMGHVRKAVLDCQELAQLILQRKGPAPVAAPKEAEETSDSADTAPSSTAPPARRMLTRDDVLDRLAEASALLLQMEPHSPIAYMIQRAVKLARLPLPDLMRVLVRDAGVLGQLDRDLDLGLDVHDAAKGTKNK
jgi:type VI secretion system protein ImpA